MTTYYEVLRPVEPADFDGSARFDKTLKALPKQGYVTCEMLKHIDKTTTNRYMSYACSKGILKRISPYERVLKLNSVKFWVTQLNDSGHKNSISKLGTKPLYLHSLARFDEWLLGRQFPSHKTVMADGQIVRQSITKSFANVEEMLYYCTESDHGTKTAQRVVREYMASDQVGKMSDNTYASIRTAIRSYFNVNDVVLNLPKIRKKRSDMITPSELHMTIEDFYRMVQNGNPSIMMRTIMMIKFQSGMDTSTFTDRFNYEGYSQIVKYFGTERHDSWSLEMCPVPITLVRVKTGVQYTTYLEHDAIAQLQRYLTWKEMKYGKQDVEKPLFMTKHNTVITTWWLSNNFSKIAVRARVQKKKISNKAYKVTIHELRDILKSTLMVSGCARYVADHVLGHAPRDSYEKQSVLYPTELRAEYAKASTRLNIFSKVESCLNKPEDSSDLPTRIRELEAEIKSSKQFKTEINMTEETHTGAIKNLQEKLDKVLSILDALPDDIKEQITEKLEDVNKLDDSDKIDDSDSTD